MPASLPSGSSFDITRQPRLNRTKTIATVGPASASPRMLEQLIEAGVDVFRLNMAHGTREDHTTAVANIRAAGRSVNLPVGILVDLAGPKIRLGELNREPLLLEPRAEVAFVRGTTSTSDGELVCSYEPLIDELQPGDRVLVGDGMVRLKVTDKTVDRAVCTVVDGGEIRSRQGVNLPGVKLGISPLSDKDLEDVAWAASVDAEFVSLSFVRRPDELIELKRRLRDLGSAAMVIAKIEKGEALDNLDAIVESADAVMVARGDLGVEIDIEKTPLAQKRIIRTCGRLGKPVIVATQMLESMHHNRFPTRAEVSDVANAILDGADVCMLSGETAIGNYPLEAVQMMHRIQVETESVLQGRPSRDFVHSSGQNHGDAVTEAVMMGAALIARRAGARLVVIVSTSAEAAILKSKQRDFIPTVAVSNQSKIVNRMSLLWGISPLLMETIDLNVLKERVSQWAAHSDKLRSGDQIVFVADTELLPGIHDTVMIWRLP